MTSWRMTLRAEQLARVRRDPSGRHHQQVLVLRRRLERVLRVHPADEHVGEADALDEAQRGGLGRTTEVGVDEHDLLAAERDRGGEVAGHRRLAVARLRAGHHDDLGRVVDVHVGQVRAQLAERLTGAGAGVAAPWPRARGARARSACGRAGRPSAPPRRR